MKIPRYLEKFLTEFDGVSIGYSEITFFQCDEIEEEQIGYSRDSKGKSLVSYQKGYWQDSWIAIGRDELGDPILLDTASESIMWAMHGEGVWEPEIIADNIKTFASIISELKELSFNRENPTSFDGNPLSKNDLLKFISLIETLTSKTEISYWESFVENLS